MLSRSCGANRTRIIVRHLLPNTVGTLVVTADFAGVWTDSRYWTQAEAQLAGSGDLILPSDAQLLEDMILSAVNSALSQARDISSAEMGKATAGLNIPGLGM